MHMRPFLIFISFLSELHASISEKMSTATPTKYTVASRRRRMKHSSTSSCNSSGSVRMKMKELQKLIPGGKGSSSNDQLFQMTADYILQLRLQLNVLQALSDTTTTGIYDQL